MSYLVLHVLSHILSYVVSKPVICYFFLFGSNCKSLYLFCQQAHPIRTTFFAQSRLTLCDPMDYSPLDSSVRGILQARRLEWVAIPFSRGSSWPRSPAFQADSLPSKLPREALFSATEVKFSASGTALLSQPQHILPFLSHKVFTLSLRTSKQLSSVSLPDRLSYSHLISCQFSSLAFSTQY